MAVSDSSLETLKCPFCGKSDIEYGLAICATCQAEIKYDTDILKNAVDPEVEAQFELRLKELSDLQEEALNSGFFKASRLQRNTTALLQQIEIDMGIESERVRERIDAYCASNDRRREVTFTRGDRAIEVDIGPSAGHS